MATWYGLVDITTGELRGVGTLAMFPDGNLAAFDGVFDVEEFGDVQPDFAGKIWNPTTRTLTDRPAPVWLDRLDDIEAWLMADADFASVWGSLSQARRTTIRTGIRRVLARVAGARRMRQAEEAPELD
jgi:hypothetical protein